MSARAMVLRGLFAASRTAVVAFASHSNARHVKQDDFHAPWSALEPEVREGWESLARLLEATPPGLLVPRDSPLAASAPPPPLPSLAPAPIEDAPPFDEGRSPFTGERLR